MFGPAPVAPLLTRSDLCTVLAISSSTLDRWIKEGRIPPANHRIGPRSPRWTRKSLDSVLGPPVETFR